MVPNQAFVLHSFIIDDILSFSWALKRQNDSFLPVIVNASLVSTMAQQC
ncbi:hypothetical protein CK203_019271 [Vitis vinifera]|uniref:Uncharacterized protein n=1 Tax=Vitis vinifera TaxID=29760 RepID=A0A438BXX0_VITVI|nr:hypothetical protein CK203_073110 [Vitis vinifera]RVX05066.1 hypothetical protein CK203_019271 [Vitis vinifera]